jgi:acetylornithine deacetylase/succinyl-diaminopimelate desuccinylase-like protein
MQDVYDYIEAHATDTVEQLARLCRQPSVSAQALGIHDMARLLVEVLREKGFDSQLHPTGGNPLVTARLQGSGPRTLLFYNHYDVQPPEPLEKWTTPPFEPTVRDGKLFARGATDNKGNIVSRLAAIEAILAVRGRLPLTVTWLVDGEEEVSSPHLPGFCREHREWLRADGCIWEDTMGRVDAPVVSLGNKGICTLELRCRTANTDFHSSFAGIYPNAAWRLAWALSSIKGPDERVLVEGFYEGVAPLEPEQRRIVDELPPVDLAQRRQLFGMTRLAGDVVDGREAARRLAVEPTCNLAGLTSGYAGPGSKTVTPSDAIARIDCRLVPDQDPDDIHTKFKVHLERRGFDDIEVRLLNKAYPSSTSLDTPLNRAIDQAAREVYGKPAIFEPLQAGATPVWVGAKVLGIPVASTGVGYVTARTHAPDENIDLRHLIEGAKYMATIIMRFGEAGAAAAK